MKKKSSLDIVVPVYNESGNIPPLLKEVEKQLSTTFDPVHIIFVDDGSIDDTESVVQEIIPAYKQLKISYYRFTKNHGKEIAVKCGLDKSNGDYCAIMDGDLQHPPEYLIEAYQKLQDTNSNLVFISPLKRTKKIHQRIGALGYKKVINSLSKHKVYLTDFTIIDQKIVSFIKRFNESDFYTRGILSVIGYKSAEIFYTPVEREIGKSNYSLIKSFNLAIDGIMSVSVKPLRISIYIGLMISLFSILYGLYFVVEKLIFDIDIPGYASLAVGMFFLGGIQLLFLGIIGEYVGKTFMQSKNRPIYTIEYEINNLN